MLSAEIITIAGASDDLPATTDPAYQMAVLSLMIRKNLENLDTEGFEYTKPEVSDFTGFKSELSTYLQNAYDRETEILQNGFATTIATLPDVLSIGAAFASGGATEAGACILNIVLGKLLGGDSGAMAGYEGKDIDSSEIVTELQNIQAELETLQGRLENTDAINVADILEKGLIDTNALDERYSVLWNIARQAIRIIVTSANDVDDVLLDEATS
jgi:hypothetical protein